MTFMNEWALWLLVPVTLFALLRRYENIDAKVPLHNKIVLGKNSNLWLEIAQIAAMILMVVALARPVSNNPSVVEEERYAPVYLALDLSASMRATDRKPSRLEYSKEIIRTLLQRDTRHSFGLFGFTTNTLILSPATMDHTLVETALQSINPDFIITRGTDLDSLIENIAKMPEAHKRLVIFSDGGDGYNLKKGVRICRERDITVYAVAAATMDGATIPDGRGGFVRDDKGRLVISMQNPSFAELARATGGAVIDTDDPSDAADRIESALSDEDLVSSSVAEVNRTELFWIPLFFASLLYLFSLITFPKRIKKAWFVLLSLVGMSHADAGMIDLWRLHKAYDLYENGDFNRSLSVIWSVKKPSLQRSFMEASAFYMVGAYKKSARILSTLASDDPAVKSMIFYDLGNCAVKIGRFKSARRFYIKSLQLRPDEDALKNLVTILFLDEYSDKKPKIAANRQVKASGSGDNSQKRVGGKKRESKSSGTGSGGGGAQKEGSSSSSLSNVNMMKHPLGFKAYELINKGYINESRPW